MAISFQSPLSNLCDVLNQIRDSAAQYQVILTKNEASTRAVLIDPILRALGWDTANTHMVEIEKINGKFRADYALYDSNREPRVIIEAKALGVQLASSEIIMSLVSYAFQFQLTNVFLTDGLIWHHYSNFHPKNHTPTHIFNLTTDNPVDVAAYLVQHLDAAKYWPIETEDLLTQRLEQLENTVATLQHLLTRKFDQQVLVSPTIKSDGLHNLSPEKFDQGNRNSPIQFAPQLKNDSTFSLLSDLGDMTGRRPTHLRLPDSTILEVKRWRDVLRECCKYALRSNLSIPVPLPDSSGKKVSLLSFIKPATGIAYLSDNYQDNTIFMYLNYDANKCVSNAIHILQYVPSKEQSTQVAVILEE